MSASRMSASHIAFLSAVGQIKAGHPETIPDDLRDLYLAQAGDGFQSLAEIAHVIYGALPLGGGAGTIANVLSKAFNATLEDIAKALHSKRGLGMSLEDTAKVLWKGLASQNIDSEDIARVLSSPEGCNVPAYEVASAVYNGIGGLDYEQIAKALYYECGIEPKDVLNALVDLNGLCVKLPVAAKALAGALSRRDVDAEEVDLEVAHAVSQTIRNLNFTTDDYLTPKDLAKNFVGVFDGKEFNKPIKDIVRLMRNVGYEPENIISGIECSVGSNSFEIANVLRDAGFLYEEIARAFYAPDGLDLAPERIAEILFSVEGCGLTKDETYLIIQRSDLSPRGKLTAEEATQVMKDGCGIDMEPVAYKTASEIKAQKKSNQGKGMK